MINSIINIDLHIHSQASEYKDGKKIVGNSNEKNIDTLFKKLNSHEIKLFSITDHNRFNLELYKEINKELSKPDNPYDFTLIPGVEFDVTLEEGMNTAHIVTIFDCKNEVDYDKISNSIEKDKLILDNESYSKERFERLLKNIGLNTILIVHQKKSIDNITSGKTASLNESTSSPYEIIKVGYVDALEYQKPQVEGILKNNLRDIDFSFPLITGSDCHDWNEYPKHSKGKNDFQGPFTSIKALPTFKGLHISLTFPKTRINRVSNSNNSHIQSIKINDKEVKLDPGINAIIGDNGSGKSTVLSMLADQMKETYIKDLVKKNKISRVFSGSNDRLKYISQSEIVNKYNNDSMIFTEEEGYFDEINNKRFSDSYELFASGLKKAIETNIKIHQSRKSLKNKASELSTEHDIENYFISIPDYEIERQNIHSDRKTALKTSIETLQTELINEYYNELGFRNNVKNILDELKLIYNSVLFEMIKEDNIDSINNLLTSKIETYKNSTKVKMNSKEKLSTAYKEKKSDFIRSVIKAIKESATEVQFPNIPSITDGTSQKRRNGFEFNREANYHNKDMQNEFFKYMFNQNYQDIDSIKRITSREMFVKALRGASEATIESTWVSNYSKFHKNAIATKKYILEANVNTEIGNTMGELSIAYYKFQIQQSEEIDVFLIDQPEDNISNSKIVENLIDYLNTVRYEKQIIIVTHNPILVINLDVDNVVSLEKINNEIKIVSGCIENEDSMILNHISSKMEGGKEMIEKRLKIYD